MKKTAKTILVLVLALLMLTTAAMASNVGGGMGNFKTARDYVPFSDVDESAWYYGDVKTAYELGIIDGRGDGIFDPDGGLKISEAITMAVRTCCLYAGQTLPSVDGDPWYGAMVDYAVQHQIIYEGEFEDYNAEATRGDMIYIFAYALPYKEYQRINRVVGIPDTSDNVAYFLYNAGILTGDENGNCNIDAPVKRSEAAAIINRIAIQENRKSVTGVRPEGTVVTGADGSFNMVIPDNGAWSAREIEESDYDEYNTPLLILRRGDKHDGIWVYKFKNPNAATLSFFDCGAEEIKRDFYSVYTEGEDNDDYKEYSPIAEGLFRGFDSVYATYTDDNVEVGYVDYTIVETKPGSLYKIVIQGTYETIDEIYDVLYTFDAEM